MSSVDTRQLSRDSLFLMALLRVEGDPAAVDYRVKVRNLSKGGMMAEGAVRVTRGSNIRVELRNVGWVSGIVAWRQEDRFGIAFAEEIDPLLVRGIPTSLDCKEETVRSMRPIGFSASPEKLRKI